MSAIAPEPGEARTVVYQQAFLPEKPLFTVELVIFTIRADQLHVLLIKRADQPCKGWWALPGGFLDPQRDDSTLRLPRWGRGTWGCIPVNMKD